LELSIASLTDNRYQITLDPAWNHERAKLQTEAKHWYEWISCKNGGIIMTCPHYLYQVLS
jgi:hypothetical protein